MQKGYHPNTTLFPQRKTPSPCMYSPESSLHPPAGEQSRLRKLRVNVSSARQRAADIDKTKGLTKNGKCDYLLLSNTNPKAGCARSAMLS
jgi:hypothetical protein